MNKLLLSILGVAAFAAAGTPVQARDHCHRSGGYSHHSYGYSRPAVRVYYAPRPVYYRSYDRGYYSSYDRGTCVQPTRRVVYRSSGDRCESRSSHGGIRGFIHRLFR